MVKFGGPRLKPQPPESIALAIRQAHDQDCRLLCRGITWSPWFENEKIHGRSVWVGFYRPHRKGFLCVSVPPANLSAIAQGATSEASGSDCFTMTKASPSESCRKTSSKSPQFQLHPFSPTLVLCCCQPRNVLITQMLLGDPCMSPCLPKTHLCVFIALSRETRGPLWKVFN
jgi:hypothetical protein